MTSVITGGDLLHQREYDELLSVLSLKDEDAHWESGGLSVHLTPTQVRKVLYALMPVRKGHS